jgi:hypothetical protein
MTAAPLPCWCASGLPRLWRELQQLQDVPLGIVELKGADAGGGQEGLSSGRVLGALEIGRCRPSASSFCTGTAAASRSAVTRQRCWKLRSLLYARRHRLAILCASG